jgi:hypothetical protein
MKEIIKIAVGIALGIITIIVTLAAIGLISRLATS